MRYKILLPLLLLLPSLVGAQTDTAARVPELQLDDVVISANKFTENKKYVSQQIMSVNKKEIEWYMPQTTAVMLEQTGNVFVQKSQLGGGSPVLRGFEASRVLLVIDGVRMNNAIYRAGHLQNAITVDNNILEKVEVLYGPASTLYGSDALGGVISFRSIDPKLSITGAPVISVNAMTRYSTAYDEKTGHADFSIGFRKFASLTSITYSSFGDLRQGNNRNPFYGDFGKRNQYVTRVGGVDSIVNNSDPNIQKGSGYHQVDLMQKFIFQQNNAIRHSLNLQYSTTSDVPRYDRLTDLRSGKLRFAEWYYGPQERFMAAYQIHIRPVGGFFNEIKGGANYQIIEESRVQRDRGKNGLQSRIENVHVAGYFLDFRKVMGRHELVIGTDGQLNDVKSEANEKNIVTGDISPLDTRYPAGGSKMNYHAVYAQHLWKLIPEKLILNDGLRYSYTSLNSSFGDSSFFDFPYQDAAQKHTAVSGNLGLVYLPGRFWKIALNGSTGFRSPNIDDLVKVFESAGGVQLVVPNPDLKPEYTYNLDLGLSYAFPDLLKVEINGFYTSFRNAIVLGKHQYNGQDSIFYGGANTAVVAAQNKARASIYGVSTGATVLLSPRVTLHGTVNYTYGRYFDENDEKAPMDHIPPVFGKLSLRYQPKAYSVEGYALFNGWKHLADYNPFGEDNQQYATVHGMPEWYTLNIRAGYSWREKLSIEMALENILDVNYRAFASGISAPGRNFVVSLRGRF
ncbi:MAG: TonB-dependent receptor [Sphingobacteriales bacterium]|nr:MAG: TonB-dependent receptor [Sphingobacteriales bacterium]